MSHGCYTLAIRMRSVCLVHLLTRVGMVQWKYVHLLEVYKVVSEAEHPLLNTKIHAVVQLVSLMKKGPFEKIGEEGLVFML